MNDGPRSGAAYHARLVGWVAALFVLAGCGNGGAEPAPTAASRASSEAVQAQPASATPGAAEAALNEPRPLPAIAAGRSIVRASDGCQEWAPGKPPRAVECPSELEPGEVLRFLTSDTCARSGAAGRDARVPCPTVRALP